MRATLIATALFAASAVAGPVLKRAYYTEITTVVVTVTVPEGYQAPTPAPVPVVHPAPVPPKPVEPKPVVPPKQPATPPKAPYKPPPKPAPAPPQASAPAPAPEPAPQPAPAPAPAPPSTNPGSPPADDDYKGGILYYHNMFRDNHTAPHLEWDDAAAAIAQQFASECREGHDAYGHPYGQNVYASTGDGPSGQAVCAWYNTECNAYTPFYGLDNPDMGVFKSFGHFTQVVWEGTTKVGCGTAQCGNMKKTVCNYSPAGNMGGEYGTNVHKPKGLPSIHA